VKDRNLSSLPDNKVYSMTEWVMKLQNCIDEPA